jgi:hypothetical protein
MFSREHTGGKGVRAKIFDSSFTGRVTGRAHDRYGPVYYVTDQTGRERAVRPNHPEHSLEVLR